MPVMKFFNTVARHGAKEVTRQFSSSAKAGAKVMMQCSLTGIVKEVDFTPKQMLSKVMMQCSLTGFFKEVDFTPSEAKSSKVMMQCSLTGLEKEVDLRVLPEVPSFTG